ncbi:MAG: hypothetical protein PVG84_14160 [Desulfobacterales bacterium]
MLAYVGVVKWDTVSAQLMIIAVGACLLGCRFPLKGCNELDGFPLSLATPGKKERKVCYRKEKN